MLTRLGLYGGPRGLYGSFAGKEQQVITVVDETATGGWEHPFMRPVRKPEEEKQEPPPQVVSPVIEVKVDRRRKPKKEKKREAKERIDLAQTYKQEFADEYFKETLTEHLRGEARAKAEAELKRKRRNRAVALLLLH